MEDLSPISGAIETVAVRLVRPIPIASAIETLADRLGATNEQAWADIKSKAAYGRLSLAGVDDKGRLCGLEPHWISYIVPWGAEDPSPALAPAPTGMVTPPLRGNPATSDMPRDNSGSIIAFDRERAIRDWQADKNDGRVPRSIPPLRMRDIVTDGAQLDDLWARAEYEFQNLDWSLGNVLSWIAFRDPLLICKFESRRNLAAKRLYDFPRSGPLGRPMVVPLADRILLDALKEGPMTAIRAGAEIPSAFWFGKQTLDLKMDLRLRRAEVISRWPADIGEQAIVPSRTAGGCEMSEEDDGRARKWQREKWRRDWIVRYAERQRAARRWIAFVDLADWGAHSTTAASADAEEQARELVYRRLSESVLRGAFEQAGRSKILYLDTFVTGDGASPRCRLTREQFEIAF